jgi:anti-anti-sigma factor
VPAAKIGNHRFHYSIVDSIAVIRLEQACDQDTTEALATLASSPIMEGRALIIDLSHAPYVETPGFRWIIRQYRQLESAGRSLVLTGLEQNVARTFCLLKLDNLIPTAGTVAEALKLLQRTKAAIPA